MVQSWLKLDLVWEKEIFMNYTKALPATGGGILVGGVVISQAWIIAVSLAIVVSAALAIRFAWRRDKSINGV